MAEAKKVEDKKPKKKLEKPEANEMQQDIVEAVEKEESKTAKAGKRSAKATRESEEKEAKEERKKSAKTEEPTKPKHQQKPPRSKLERKGKNYRKKAGLIDKTKTYKLDEALELACKTTNTKFDSTVELHLRLNVDPKQADQNIRDNVVLPAGSGKKVRVAVFADDVNAKKAKAAGAEITGDEDFLRLLDKGEINFDVLISMPNMMARLAKYARILGPKGLMPNPKSGTVTTDVVKAVEQSRAGKIEYRVDSNGIIHVGIGKVSIGDKKLGENAAALIASVKSNKPASVKSAYVRTVFVTTTMGPSIQIDPSGL